MICYMAGKVLSLFCYCLVCMEKNYARVVGTFLHNFFFFEFGISPKTTNRKDLVLSDDGNTILFNTGSSSTLSLSMNFSVVLLLRKNSDKELVGTYVVTCIRKYEKWQLENENNENINNTILNLAF